MYLDGSSALTLVNPLFPNSAYEIGTDFSLQLWLFFENVDSEESNGVYPDKIIY